MCKRLVLGSSGNVALHAGPCRISAKPLGGMTARRGRETVQTVRGRRHWRLVALPGALDFRKHGDSSAAGKSLKAALDENKRVPAYLLGRKEMPRSLPGHYGFGDDNEAVLYAHGNRAAWKATPGALEWVAANAK